MTQNVGANREFQMFLHSILEDTTSNKEAFSKILGTDVPTMLKQVHYVLANLTDDSYLSQEDAEQAKSSVEEMKTAWRQYTSQKQNVQTAGNVRNVRKVINAIRKTKAQ